MNYNYLYLQDKLNSDQALKDAIDAYMKEETDYAYQKGYQAGFKRSYDDIITRNYSYYVNEC